MWYACIPPSKCVYTYILLRAKKPEQKQTEKQKKKNTGEPRTVKATGLSPSVRGEVIELPHDESRGDTLRGKTENHLKKRGRRSLPFFRGKGERERVKLGERARESVGGARKYRP